MKEERPLARASFSHGSAGFAWHPRVDVQGYRALVVSGEGQRLLMAGGGASWMDMALFLIARLLGVEAAVRSARLNLIDWHDIGQQPFASLARSRRRTMR
jgi:transcriptional regulator GlxA family with amidase domain